MLARSGRLLVPAALLLAAPQLLAQGTGRIAGRVVDAGHGAPIAGATVELVGGSSPRTVTTSLDGRYLLTGVPTGAVMLRVRMIGYGAKVVTDITVTAGSVTTLDVSLDPEAAVQLEELTVTAAAERGSVASALNEQRQSFNVVNAITAEEIGRSPDGDAAAAVQRVSGVSVQDGKFVFVRGLGERYTTTSLNGSRIPSSEPERKVVPLDLFPAGLLEGISTSKTFTPDLPGDFSGAEVNIRTREFPAQRRFSFSVSSTFNNRVIGKDVYRSRNAGGEWFAVASRNRQVPDPVEAAEDFEPAPSQSQVNAMVNSFRNAWSPVPESGLPGSSFGMSVGGKDPVFGRPIGYLVSASYSFDAETRAEQIRATARPGATPGSAEERDHYEGSTGRGTTLWGGLVNLSTDFGASSRVTLSTTYNRSADNDARFEEGTSENLGGEFQILRLQYVERSAVSTQLKGEHQVSDRHRLNWSGTYARVTRKEPDRSEFVYQLDTDPFGNPLPPSWFSISNEGAVRTFADLAEYNVQGNLDYQLTFGGRDLPHTVKLGGVYRYTDRDAINRSYSISANLDRASQELAPEQIFDGRFAEPADQVFRITPLSAGGTYVAEDNLLAGYAMVQFFPSARIEIVAGARVENSKVSVTTQPTVGNPVTSEPTYTDVLPAATVNVSLTESHVLRFAASQTLSRPEYRELSPVQYREVLDGDNIIGNPDLQRALIRNADVRWEWYPRPTEVISLGVFGKWFEDPIERIYLATSGTNVISYLNAESAYNYGVEAEVRKNLGTFSEALLPFSFFANATLMKSEVTIQGGSVALNDQRALVGQAPYVVNSGLTFTSTDGRWAATGLYNVVGRRIVSAGVSPLPDIYEELRHVVDFSLRFPVWGALTGKFDAKNLLDPAVKVTQGAVTREFYRTGRRFTVGLTWAP